MNIYGSQLDTPRKFRFFQEGIDRLQAVPGVTTATASAPILMSGSESTTAMYVQGRAYPQGRESYSADRDEVYRVRAGPNYFKTMGMSLVAGRSFDQRNHQQAPEVAILNEAAARKFFPTKTLLASGSENQPIERISSRSSECCEMSDTTNFESHHLRRGTCRTCKVIRTTLRLQSGRPSNLRA